MEDENPRQKLTENRNSYEKTVQRVPLSQKIILALCPCLVKPNFAEQNSSQTLSKGGRNTDIRSSTETQKDRKFSFQFPQKKQSQQTEEDSNDIYYPYHHNTTLWNGKKKKSQLTISVHERFERYNLQNDAQFLTKSTIKKWHSYPIYHHKENQLTILGTTKGRLLAVISSQKVQPSALSRKKNNKAYPYEKMQRSYSSSNVDRFWNKRYFLFEKFDEGISLDEQSWSSMTPEAVAQYISNKIRCQTVLDAFCGAGGDSIKLANTCSRVIANDICSRKLQCLNNNAKVYSVENIEMINQNFLQLDNIQPDIVYINPATINLDPLREQNCLNHSSFSPPMDKIISKAIKLSKNIVFLVPSNINVTKFSQCIASQYMKQKIPAYTCSIKIQKIFFMSQLKYLAIYLGNQVQNDIKLNDELCFIYNLLKDGEPKKPFRHRKIVKRIREQYGMMNLLNFVLDSQKMERNTKMEKFYAYIREKGILSQQKLEEIIKQQNKQNQQFNKKKIPLLDDNKIDENESQMNEQMQQQKYVNENSDRQNCNQERTVSYYSMGSAQNRMSIIPKQVSDGQSDPRELYASSVTSKQIHKSVTLNRSNTLEFCPRYSGSLSQVSQSQY